MLGFLADAGIEVCGSQATFYVWFRAPGGDDAAYAEALLRERIVASPGRAFGPGGSGLAAPGAGPDRRGVPRGGRALAAAIEAGRLPR